MHRTATSVSLACRIAGCALVAPWNMPSQLSIYINPMTSRMNTHSQAGGAKELPRQKPKEEKVKRTKTIAQLDKDLEEKLAGLAGDGGSAGVEYEDGKPAAMKRSVKNNMFRYI